MLPINLRYFIFSIILLGSTNGNLDDSDDCDVKCFKSIPPTAACSNVPDFFADCSQQSLHNMSNVLNWLYKDATNLDLSSNYIEHIPLLPPFSKIRTLNLNHNNIKTIEEKAFSNFVALEVLDLSHNFLTGWTLRADVLRGNFSSTTYEPLPIKVLLLGFNQIETLSYQTFEHLPHLKELRLSGNPLDIVDFTMEFSTQLAIQSLGSLKILDLGKTGLSQIPKQMFDNMKLESLYINGNNFTKVPEELSVLKMSLEFIDINENPMVELNSNSFIGLNHLKEIVASGMRNLTAIKGGTFTHLENLETLTCSYNPELSYIDEDAFSHEFTPKIKNVYLNDNKFRTIPKHLLPWDQLQKLTLHGNRWSCDCRNQWLLDFEQQKNQTLISHSELICWEPTWLNGTSFEVLRFPFGRFICENANRINGVIIVKSIVDFLILLMFIAIIFFTSGLIVSKIATSKRSVTSDATTDGGNKHIVTNIRYNKLDEVRIM